MSHATGTFDVKLTPQPASDADADLGRLTIDKQFHGDLEGSSRGVMVAAGTAVTGSAVYVAIETVTGTLQGRHGTFILHHLGLMERGTGTLTIAVVNDSGTDGLVGLTGTMHITVADGRHSWNLEYSLPDAR
jgi:Protein of unknown function (DUF3224)